MNKFRARKTTTNNFPKTLEPPHALQDQDEGDTFGLLADSEKSKIIDLPTSPYFKEELQDDTEVFHRSEKKSIQWYNSTLRKLLKQGKLKDALELYEWKMLHEDKVKPSHWTYSLLINGCGAAGYTKKAFNLFKSMRDRGMKPTPATVTGLFVACSNSPWKEDGLKRAKYLREKMFEIGWNMNAINYHAMITAFGKCGDITTAFQIVDEMMSLKIPLEIRTICSLLSSCISDPKEGLKNAILVWRRLRVMKMKPDIHCYNLLLRTIRDCNVGESPAKLLLNSKNQDGIKKILLDKDAEPLHMESDLRNKITHKPTTVDEATIIPDILSPDPASSNIISLVNMDKRENRLALFGGLPGILSQMVSNKVKPDVKTFTQLLDVIPMTKSSEEQLLDAIDEHEVDPDVDLCNMIIKRRALRFHDLDALEVLDITMKKYGISPNIMTYGVLALICRTHKKTSSFLKSIDDSGIRLNVEIIGTLVNNACFAKDPKLFMILMKRIKDDDIAVSPLLLKNLDKFIQSKECQENEKYKNLRMMYKDWLRTISLDVPEHPWKQYSIQKPKLEDSENDLDNESSKKS
ncbi:Pentatricopeptide repeat-containing protein 1, mitochondrial [Nymphon striatum]|nr:Pentatricopeptide repeat-containing protein 1, mitochondrial [Nymphon striatum]